MDLHFTDNFEKDEWFARQALLELKPFKEQIHFTTDKYAVFDAYLHILNEETYSIKKWVFIELKWRQKIHPDYILEKKKLKDLIEKRNELFIKPEDCILMYICFTPEGTFIWNISNVDPNKTQKLNCNKTTEKSREHKIDKDVIYLKKEDAKKYNYILDEKKIINNMIIDKEMEKTKKRIKGFII